jgi:hypothetical protein
MRLKIFIISVILVMFGMISAKAQLSMTIGSRQVTESVSSEVPVFVGNPDSIGISTSEFSRLFPKAGIKSEEIKINYPNLKGAIDTACILWYLKPENYSPKGEVNIIIVTMGADSVKTFYIDNNNDRTFSDNEDKFVFDKEEEKRVLDIRILGNFYKYTLMNPDYVSPFSAPSRIKEYSASWRKSSKKPSIDLDFSILTGGGKTEMTFEHPESIYFRYKYVANNHGSFKPALGIDFSWFNFHIIFTEAYERLQFESVVKYEYSSPTSKGIRTYNRNMWPNSMIHSGISAEYDFRIYKVYLSPFVTYTISKNLDSRTFDRLYPDGKLSDWYSYEAGAKFKIPIANKTMIYLRYTYSQSYFVPTGFFPESVPVNTSHNFVQNYFGFGFQYRILGK